MRGLTGWDPAIQAFGAQQAKFLQHYTKLLQRTRYSCWCKCTCLFRGVSQREQITSAIQKLSWLPAHFRMPLQMLIYKAAWCTTTDKVAAARIPFHAQYSWTDTVLTALAFGFRENCLSGSPSLGPSTTTGSYLKGSTAAHAAWHSALTCTGLQPE